MGQVLITNQCDDLGELKKKAIPILEYFNNLGAFYTDNVGLK